MDAVVEEEGNQSYTNIDYDLFCEKAKGIIKDLKKKDFNEFGQFIINKIEKVEISPLKIVGSHEFKKVD